MSEVFFFKSFSFPPSFLYLTNISDMAKMGGTVVRGETQATVVLTGKNTFFGKTAAMLNTGEEMSNMTKLLLRIMLVLVIASITLSLTCFIYLLVEGYSIKVILYFPLSPLSPLLFSLPPRDPLVSLLC